jgi:nucleoside-diphosphate-sugar epimerase
VAAGERVLITGGSGFLGACLVRDLVTAGQDVHLLLRPHSNTWRLSDLAGRFTPHQADMLDAAALRRVVAACRPHVVYHLAAHGVYPFQKERAAILATNLLGTANLLDALVGVEYRALINVGTSAEYGMQRGLIPEDAPPEPVTDYGVAKAAASLLCRAEAGRGLPIITVRVFAAYGPGEAPSRLVAYVMGCCLRGEPPRVTAGRQRRDFIYAGDIVALLQRAAQCPEARGRVLHAATGKAYSVRDMVETIVRVCGGRVSPVFGAEPDRPGEPDCRVAAIGQTTALTGWTPRHDLEAGVAQTWALYQAAAARAA